MAAADTTLAKITAEIASHLQKELDEPFKRMLADKVGAWRSQLLHRALEDKPQERKFFLQTIYAPLEVVDPVPDCIDPNAPVCDVMRTTMKIPKAVRAGGLMYDYIGSSDGNNAFKYASPGTRWVLSKGRYSKRHVWWEDINGFIDVHNAIGLPLLRITAPFDKPEEAAKFNCETVGQGCDFWNEPYPITGDIKQQVVELILKVDFQRPEVPSNKEVELNPQIEEHAPSGR